MKSQSYIEYMQAYSSTHTHRSGSLYSISAILVLGIRVMGLVFRVHYGNGKNAIIFGHEYPYAETGKIAEGIYMKFDNGKFY